MKRDWSIFISSVFFVLGFSVVFSLVGVLLQGVLSHVSGQAQMWLGRAGGLIIILFGLFLLGLIQPAFLTRDHKIAVKKRFGSYYLTSFVFGAAFAVGWTPCVSAALGAILALAASHAGSAFLLLFAYTLGIGIPFLLVGFFTNRAERFITKSGPWLKYVEYVFGAFLVIVGTLFVGQLSKIGDIPFLVNLLSSLNLSSTAGGSIASLTFLNLSLAFLAGVTSFLSPCILPIVPGFLSYIASTGIKKQS